MAECIYSAVGQVHWPPGLSGTVRKKNPVFISKRNIQQCSFKVCSTTARQGLPLYRLQRANNCCWGTEQNKSHEQRSPAAGRETVIPIQLLFFYFHIFDGSRNAVIPNMARYYRYLMWTLAKSANFRWLNVSGSIELSRCAFRDVLSLTPLRISPQQSEQTKEKEGDDLETGSKLPAGDFGKETLSWPESQAALCGASVLAEVVWHRWIEPECKWDQSHPQLYCWIQIHQCFGSTQQLCEYNSYQSSPSEPTEGSTLLTEGYLIIRTFFVFLSQLTQLPAVICQLRNLQVLNLCNNRLTCLPAEFGLLSKLHTLSLAVNQIEFLPHSFVCLRALRQISLADNRFTRYPGCLNKIKTLKSVNLDRNPLVTKAAISDSPMRAERFHVVMKNLLCQDCQNNYDRQQYKLTDVSWKLPTIRRRTKFLEPHFWDEYLKVRCIWDLSRWSLDASQAHWWNWTHSSTHLLPCGESLESVQLLSGRSGGSPRIAGPI